MLPDAFLSSSKCIYRNTRGFGMVDTYGCIYLKLKKASAKVLSFGGAQKYTCCRMLFSHSSKCISLGACARDKAFFTPPHFLARQVPPSSWSSSCLNCCWMGILHPLGLPVPLAWVRAHFDLAHLALRIRNLCFFWASPTGRMVSLDIKSSSYWQYSRAVLLSLVKEGSSLQ